MDPEGGRRFAVDAARDGPALPYFENAWYATSKIQQENGIKAAGTALPRRGHRWAGRYDALA